MMDYLERNHNVIWPVVCAALLFAVVLALS